MDEVQVVVGCGQIHGKVVVEGATIIAMTGVAVMVHLLGEEAICKYYILYFYHLRCSYDRNLSHSVPLSGTPQVGSGWTNTDETWCNTIYRLYCFQQDVSGSTVSSNPLYF